MLAVSLVRSRLLRVLRSGRIQVCGALRKNWNCVFPKCLCWQPGTEVRSGTVESCVVTALFISAALLKFWAILADALMRQVNFSLCKEREWNGACSSWWYEGDREARWEFEISWLKCHGLLLSLSFSVHLWAAGQVQQHGSFDASAGSQSSPQTNQDL